MKIPYGIANFKSLKEEGYLYVDKTKYIELLENGSSKYVFFIRPRRFGKSLFLSVIRSLLYLVVKMNIRFLMIKDRTLF